VRTDLRLQGRAIGSTPENRTALMELNRRNLSAELAGASLSGHERNHLFLSRQGIDFADVSALSGLDGAADGRAFGILDYDRDGWLDIAIVNANAPFLQLFRNQIGDRPRADSQASAGKLLAVRFVGGNHTAAATTEWSTRDGYGAVVEVDLGEQTLVREHRAGEGFAAQNSATLGIGIGPAEAVPAVTVRWPSGRVQTARNVSADTLPTFYENPADSPDGSPFVGRPYRRRLAPDRAVAASSTHARRPRLELTSTSTRTTNARLRLYTTMATWCVACQTELPQLQRLREAFAEEELAMFGVPVDPREDADKIEAWRAAYQPVYELLSGLTPKQKISVSRLVVRELGMEAVPATLITDAADHVLHAQWGPPSISKLRELLTSVP
jgi:thiol-disulfide isomerase/thioredoxin